MREYCAIGNNEIVLLSVDTDECAVFDSFGKFILKTSYREGLARLGVRPVEPVKLCSISGKSLASANTDVYYNGKRKSVSMSHSVVFREVQKFGSGGLKLPIPCRMTGVDGVSIIILVFKDSYSLESFGKNIQILGNSDWLEV